MRQITHTLPALLLAALAWPLAASASSLEAQVASANRINAANEMVREGKLDEAIDSYRQVQPTDDDRDALQFNLGVAQFRSGDLAAAKEAFTAAAASGDARLASSSRYNLGNCLYAGAVQQAQQDKAAAIGSLQEAIAHYRGALRGDPDNADARANIELASQLIRKLQEEQQQQQQQQKQNQDQQQQDSNSDQQQNQQDSQSQQSENQDSQDSESESQSSQSQGEGQESESQPKEENQSNSSEQQGDKSDDESSSESSEEKPSELSNEQQSQSSDDQQGKPSQANEQQSAAGEPSPSEEDAQEQEVPAGELSAAGEQEQQQGEPRAAAMADPGTDDGLMSKEEALKMLQAVRDRDMLRRLRQQQAERSRHVPVDRDW